MTKRLRELLARKQQKVEAANAILNAGAAEDRVDLTDEESTNYDAILGEIAQINAAIERENTLMQAEHHAQILPADARQALEITGGVARLEHDPCGGFDSLGEFATVVRVASRRANAVIDERLAIQAAAPGVAGSEGVGEDGGFAVPPEFRTDIMSAVTSEESLFGMTDQIPIQRNSIKMPVDETTDWQTTGGILAFWENELEVLTASKPKIKEAEWSARKITALVNVSSELLEDASAMDSFLRRKAPGKIGFKIDLAIVRGTGAGQPLGILLSPALISIAKESGQVADTLVRANIENMFMRMPSALRRTAIWIINQDVEAQLQALAFIGTNSPVPLFMPAGGLSASPFSTLKGRPVVYHQATSTLGDQGDVILADMRQYATVVKRGGIKVDVSMHLYFDADAMAFRFILRVGGHPWLSAPVQPRVGSNTLSPFVTLDERA